VLKYNKSAFHKGFKNREVRTLSVHLDSSVVRDINTRKVLSAVRQKMSTRTELARITHLSYPTVGTIIKDLAEDGFVVDECLGEFGGGRKPMLVKFVPTARYIIGVNLGGAEPQAVLSDLNGAFVSSIVKGNIEHLEEDTTGSVIRLIEDLRSVHPFSWDRVIGLGVSVRGSFDIPNGHYYYPGRTTPLRLQDDLEKRFGVPVILERNASAAALSEWVRRKPTGVRSILFINVDKGVSSGLVVDGQLVRGFLGNAGEFGHVVVDRSGELCPDCGQKGCLENVASLGAIADEARREGILFLEHDSVLDNYRDLVARARSGDDVALKCFARVTEVLGRATTSLVNVINPQLLVVGGRVIWHYPELLDAISDFVVANCWPYSKQGLEFALATENKHNFLHGAIALILDRLFVSIGEEFVADWSSHREFMGGRGRLA
jgi:predicted NBD/HSP70 family sugar kinase